MPKISNPTCFNTQYKPHKAEYVRRFKKDVDGRLYRDDVSKPDTWGATKKYILMRHKATS